MPRHLSIRLPRSCHAGRDSQALSIRAADQILLAQTCVQPHIWQPTCCYAGRALLDILDYQIKAPTKWQTFKDLACTLFEVVWKDPTAQKNGRTGQRLAAQGVQIEPGRDRYLEPRLEIRVIATAPGSYTHCQTPDVVGVQFSAARVTCRQRLSPITP